MKITSSEFINKLEELKSNKRELNEYFKLYYSFFGLKPSKKELSTYCISILGRNVRDSEYVKYSNINNALPENVNIDDYNENNIDDDYQHEEDLYEGEYEEDLYGDEDEYTI